MSHPDVAMIPELVHTLGVTADEILGCQNVSESNKQTVLNQDQIDYTSKTGRKIESDMIKYEL